MSLRPRGRASFVVLVCLALGGAEVPGSDVDRLTAPRDRLDFRGSRFSPGFYVRHSTSDSIVVTLSLGELTIRSRTTRNGIWHHVLMDGGERLGWLGAPDLPVYRRLVAVPDGGDVRVTAHPRARTVVTGLKVPMLGMKDDRASGRSKVFSHGMTPVEIAAVEHVGYLRGQRLASVLVSPARYNAVLRELDVTTDMELVVTVEDATGDVLQNVGPLENALKGTVLNAGAGLFSTANTMSGARRGVMSAGGQVCWCSGSNWQDAAASAISCGADYLMIVSDSLVVSTMVDTLALRRAEYNGFNVAIVKMSQIDAAPDTANTPVSIRALIDSVYTSESATHMGDGRLGYVLLVGDAYDVDRQVLIPSYYGYADTLLDDHRKASDAYYSLLDDDPVADRFPDVLVGRLPVDRDDTDWEITNLVRKIVSYEPVSGDVWADSILVVSGNDPGGFTFAGQGVNGFRAFFDSVLTYYPPAGKVATQQHRLAMTGSPSDTTKHRIFGNKIRASMARGKWITAFFDHGFPFYWSGAFYPRSYEFIPDTGSPSIVFSIASNTTQFDLTADWALNVMGSCAVGDGCTVQAPSSMQCESPGYGVVDPCDVIMERLLVQEGGAVAAIGYSRTQDTFSAQADFTNLFRSLSDQNPTTLGELLVGARMFRISNEITARNLMLLGDPALDIRTRAPAAQDTVDVAVGIHDIRVTGEAEGEVTYYVDSNSSLALTATIRNPWRADAFDVDVEFWQGMPGAQGSTLLASSTLDSVPAYGSETVNFNVGDPSGNFDVFVVLDPDGEITERNEDNNVASRAFLGLPYIGDYPVRLGMNPSRPIVVADITSDMGKEFLVSGALEVRCYAVGDTSAQWSHQVNLIENEILMNTPVDGMRRDYFDRYADLMPTLSALRRRAAWFSQAHVNILPSNTAVGHSTISTGTDPSVHGITGVSVYDRIHRRRQNLFDGMMPQALMALTLADVWQLATSGRAIVLAQGSIDRAATPLAGHGACQLNGAPVVLVSYDEATGFWHSNPDYFRLPDYLKDRNASTLWSAESEWLHHRIDSPAAVRRSALFPAFEADAMLAMIEHEPVGEDSVADLLLLNYKGADFVGHRYGPDSDELRLTLGEMDRNLARIIGALEAKVGKNYLLAVTADHGMPSAPPERPHFVPELVDLLHQKFDPEAKQLVTLYEPENAQMFVDEDRLLHLGLTLGDLARFLEAQPFVFAVFTHDDVRRAADAAMGRVGAMPARSYLRPD